VIKEKETVMPEARVWTLNLVVLVLIGIASAATGQWLGVLGSGLGALNAWAARWFLLKWKPSAAIAE